MHRAAARAAVGLVLVGPCFYAALLATAPSYHSSRPRHNVAPIVLELAAIAASAIAVTLPLAEAAALRATRPFRPLVLGLFAPAVIVVGAAIAAFVDGLREGFKDAWLGMGETLVVFTGDPLPVFVAACASTLPLVLFGAPRVLVRPDRSRTWLASWTAVLVGGLLLLVGGVRIFMPIAALGFALDLSDLVERRLGAALRRRVLGGES